MLPEQVFREIDECEELAADLQHQVLEHNLCPAETLNAVAQIKRQQQIERTLLSLKVAKKYKNRRWALRTHTLTGDAWRAAMDAQDRATDKALDAIY